MNSTDSVASRLQTHQRQEMLLYFKAILALSRDGCKIRQDDLKTIDV